MWGFSPGSLKLKESGSRQTGHSSSSSGAEWLETTGRGPMGTTEYGWRLRVSLEEVAVEVEYAEWMEGGFGGLRLNTVAKPALNEDFEGESGKEGGGGARRGEV